MKVLIDAHPAIQKKTGMGRYIDNLIRTLPQVGKVGLALYNHSPVPKTYRKFPSYLAPFKNGVFRVFWGLIHATFKLKPDLVHVQYFSPIIKIRPTVVTVHDVCFRTHPQKYPLKTRLIFKLFFLLSIIKADAIICTTEEGKKELLRLYSVDPNKISVVNMAVDSLFDYLPNKRAVKNILEKKFGIRDKYFLVVGNIELRKEPFGIINAFKTIQKKYKDISLVFVGPNLLGDSISKRYKKLIKKGRIKILGFVSDKDLNLLYNGSLSLIYFSSCEGFGLPLLEAMSCKTPVICSNLGVFKEIVKDSAIFVRNKKELVQGMERIIKDKNFRRKLSLKGYKQAKAFSWKKTAEETLEIYRQILGRA